jgi:hypothetical protein
LLEHRRELLVSALVAQLVCVPHDFEQGGVQALDHRLRPTRRGEYAAQAGDAQNRPGCQTLAEDAPDVLSNGHASPIYWLSTRDAHVTTFRTRPQAHTAATIRQ